jgi:transposase-like protein
MTEPEPTAPKALDWAAIRVAYETSDLTVRAIAEEHGIAPTQIYTRVRVEGWPMRSTRQAPPKARYGRPVGRRRPRDTSLVGRMMKLVNRNLKLMETRMKSGDDVPAAASRTLDSLTRTIGKITELQSAEDAAATAPKSRAEPAYDNDEAERLRLEIVERLLRLRERTGA